MRNNVRVRAGARLRRVWPWTGIALGLSLLSNGVVAATAPLSVENTLLQTDIKGRASKLEVVVLREPDVTGRLPLALVTHGGDSKEFANAYLPVARTLARRGYLAVIVMRRGFGKSDADGYVQPRRCDAAEVAALVNAQADDIEAAIKAVGKRNDADVNQTIVFGASLGGLVALDIASRQIPGMRAAINVAGGFRAGGNAECANEKNLVPMIQTFGERTRIPTLWIYAENDKVTPPDLARRLLQTYAAKGGRSHATMFPPIGKDGHQLLLVPDATLGWIPEIDRFLKENKFKGYDRAPIDRLGDELRLSPPNRQTFNDYHGRPNEKVLAISNDNQSMTATWGSPLEDLEKQALQECAGIAKQACRILLRNAEIVKRK